MNEILLSLGKSFLELYQFRAPWKCLREKVISFSGVLLMDNGILGLFYVASVLILQIFQDH